MHSRHPGRDHTGIENRGTGHGPMLLAVATTAASRPLWSVEGIARRQCPHPVAVRGCPPQSEIGSREFLGRTGCKDTAFRYGLGDFAYI